MVIEDNFRDDWENALSGIERISSASNVVFAITFDNGQEYIFKPSAGERPLWDFESGTLWQREYLAYKFFNFFRVKVPKTYQVDSREFGPGLIIEKIDQTNQTIVEISQVNAPEIPNWLVSCLGYDHNNLPVKLIHLNNSDLRRIALVDYIVNNADRKASHILTNADGFYAIDHGLCFHSEDKLRTFLWGWSEQSLTNEESNLLLRLIDNLDSWEMDRFISIESIDSLYRRLNNLIESQKFPSFPQDRYPLPSPIF